MIAGLAGIAIVALVVRMIFFSKPADGGDAAANKNGDDRKHSSRSWIRIALLSALVPVVTYILLALVLSIIAGDLDFAFALDVSEVVLFGLLVASSGLLAGVVVGLFAGIRGWKLTAPSSSGLIVGLVIYLAFAVFGGREALDFADLDLLVIWIGLSVGIFLGTRLTGYTLVGAAAATTVIGVGAAAVLQAFSETSEPTICTRP